MVGLVVAGIRAVGGVDATHNVIVEVGTMVGDDPFGGVPSLDVHHAPFRHPDFVQALGEGKSFRLVLVPSPDAIFAILLLPEGRLVSTDLSCSQEHLGVSGGLQVLPEAAASHLNGQFLVHVIRPVQPFAICDAEFFRIAVS